MQTIHAVPVFILIAVAFFALGWTVAWRMLSRSLPASLPTRMPAPLEQGLTYTTAEWRSTMPFNRQSSRIGIGFDLADGSIVRLSLAKSCARHVAESVLGYLSEDQSERSSGIPSEAGLTPQEGQNVTPLATSSAAT